jgi:hypothetical protein
LPWALEQDLLGKAALDSLLNDPERERNFWAPLRRGALPAQIPTRIIARYEADRCQVTIEGIPNPLHNQSEGIDHV